MMVAGSQRGLWRMALSLAVAALLMLSLAPAWAAADAACACPCEDGEVTQQDMARRPSCCPAEETQAFAGTSVAPPPHLEASVPERARLDVERTAVVPRRRQPRPGVRGPPRPPPAYLLQHALLL